MFFEATTEGIASLQSTRSAVAAITPLVWYGLTCIPQQNGKCEFNRGQSSSFEPAQGNYGKWLRLKYQAPELLEA